MGPTTRGRCAQTGRSRPTESRTSSGPYESRRRRSRRAPPGLVPNCGDASVSIIDAGSATLVTTIGVGSMPFVLNDGFGAVSCSRSTSCRDELSRGRARAAFDRLLELDPGLDRSAERAGARDPFQASSCASREVAAELDRDSEPARRRAMVVVDRDRHLTEVPVLRPRIHHERRRDAGCECCRKQLVRRRRAAVTAEPFGLVGDQPVLPSMTTSWRRVPGSSGRSRTGS